MVARDGSVWLSEFSGNKLARFDPQSETFEEFDIPTANAGCRTMLQDQDGAIWCPESAPGKLLRLVLP